MDFHTDIWYLVKTKPRMEEMAEINLKNQSIEYFIPRFANGKREGKVIFPGYIFIKPKSGHSFRIGAALDLLNRNIPLEKIMLRGGWKSETSTMRYLQSWNDHDWLIIN